MVQSNLEIGNVEIVNKPGINKLFSLSTHLYTRMNSLDNEQPHNSELFCFPKKVHKSQVLLHYVCHVLIFLQLDTRQVLSNNMPGIKAAYLFLFVLILCKFDF